MSTPCVTAQTVGTLRNDFSGFLGFRFTAAAGITIDQLGRWVTAGNALTHLLTLYDWTAAAVIASVIVDCNGAPSGAYLYGAITPITLVSGQIYSVSSQELNLGDQWGDLDSITTDPTFATPGTVNAVVNNTGVFFANQGYIPVNFTASILVFGTRLAQITAEVLSPPIPGRARLAQISVEVLHSIDAQPPSGGTTGKWFSDLWDPEMMDDPGEVWQE